MKVYHDTLALITDETIDAMMEKVPEDKRVAMNARAYRIAMARITEEDSDKNNKLIKQALEKVDLLVSHFAEVCAQLGVW